MQRSPQQIAESSRNLPRIRAKFPGRKSPIRKNAEGFDTFDGQCPSHDDKHASLSFTVGKLAAYIWNCHVACSREQNRTDLIGLYGIPEDWLGNYAAGPKPRVEWPADDLARWRRENDALRAELAEVRAERDRLRDGQLAVLADKSVTRPADLRARMLLIIEGKPRPGSYREIRELAERAGAGTTQAKDLAGLWLQQLLLAG